MPRPRPGVGWRISDLLGSSASGGLCQAQSAVQALPHCDKDFQVPGRVSGVLRPPDWRLENALFDVVANRPRLHGDPLPSPEHGIRAFHELIHGEGRQRGKVGDTWHCCSPVCAIDAALSSLPGLRCGRAAPRIRAHRIGSAKKLPPAGNHSRPPRNTICQTSPRGDKRML